MKNKEFLENLKSIKNKTYFAYADLQKIYPGKEKNLKVILNRFNKQKKLIQILKGWYTLDKARLDYEALACELVKPSYISLEYALHLHGIINQVPNTITLITLKKSKNFNLENYNLEYARIKQDLYFGFKIQDKILIAEAEKALLDELYLISRGKRHFGLDDLNLENINKTRFKKWLKLFPKYTQELAKSILK
ncbi:hypothetical protein CL633_03895 [bacterium]|nr:hypothetical protein [bacterium]|tara:strand:- start:1063 stop:1641 length:579 start_codon:yes stop_codon:yes gene_type:complete